MNAVHWTGIVAPTVETNQRRGQRFFTVLEQHDIEEVAVQQHAQRHGVTRGDRRMGSRFSQTL